MRERSFWGTCLLVWMIPPVVLSAQVAPGNITPLPQIRPGCDDVAAILQLGRVRSPNLGALVARLEDSPVVVYVRFARCSGRAPACLHYLGSRDQVHYVRISLDRFAGRDETLCSLLAHELQHAAELANSPEIRTLEGLRRCLERIGHRWGEGFETAAAVAVEREVRRDLTAGRSRPPWGERP